MNETDGPPNRNVPIFIMCFCGTLFIPLAVLTFLALFSMAFSINMLRLMLFFLVALAAGFIVGCILFWGQRSENN